MPDSEGITVTDPTTGKTVTLKPGEAYSTEFAPDPLSPLSADEQMKQEEMQAYQDVLLRQDVADRTGTATFPLSVVSTVTAC